MVQTEPMTDTAATRVAVYLDFDNIVISRYDQVHGRNTFKKDKAKGLDLDRLAEATVDVGAVLDFSLYSVHWLSHRVRWLWRFHAIHHSARRLYWLNSTRMHPVDMASTLVISLAPLALLGAPAHVLALFDAFAITHLVLQNEIPLQTTVAFLEYAKSDKAGNHITTIFNPSPMLSNAQVESFPWSSIDVLVGKLRRKLGDAPRGGRLIKTVRGIGYLFAAPSG